MVLIPNELGLYWCCIIYAKYLLYKPTLLFSESNNLLQYFHIPSINVKIIFFYLFILNTTFYSCAMHWYHFKALWLCYTNRYFYISINLYVICAWMPKCRQAQWPFFPSQMTYRLLQSFWSIVVISDFLPAAIKL